MSMKAFASTCDRVAATSKRLEKTILVAEYLKACSLDDLDAAARFFQGRVLPPRETQPAIGSRTIIDAARLVFNLTSQEVRDAYRTFGDGGEALASLYAPPLDFALFRQQLSPASLRDRLRKASEFRGPEAARLRRSTLESIFMDCTDAREVAAVAKVVSGELRIGLREGLILDAISQAFERPLADVRRAAAAHADFGMVATAAKNDALLEIKPAYGIAVPVMLATAVVYGSKYPELDDGEWIAEDKFDGIRAQLHYDGTSVSIFSRTGNDIGESFPELCTGAARLFTSPLICDGEIIAARSGHPLPFRELQPRLQRKHPDAAMQEQIPVSYFAFDLLADGNNMLMDAPWAERRERLSARFTALNDEHEESSRFFLATTEKLPTPINDGLDELFLAARERGHEGLVMKRIDSPYTPGRRGMSWLKLKTQFDTFDVVVVGVEWGHGKRAGMLSDYTFAVRDDVGNLLTIGKAYNGLTDAEIIAHTTWFQERMTGEMLSRRTYAVQPELIIEIAFDIIAPSTLHQSGYALRFPRILRIRDDKPINEITDLAQVEENVSTYRRARTPNRIQNSIDS